MIEIVKYFFKLYENPGQKYILIKKIGPKKLGQKYILIKKTGLKKCRQINSYLKHTL